MTPPEQSFSAAERARKIRDNIADNVHTIEGREWEIKMIAAEIEAAEREAIAKDRENWSMQSEFQKGFCAAQELASKEIDEHECLSEDGTIKYIQHHRFCDCLKRIAERIKEMKP